MYIPIFILRMKERVIKLLDGWMDGMNDKQWRIEKKKERIYMYEMERMEKDFSFRLEDL